MLLCSFSWSTGAKTAACLATWVAGGKGVAWSQSSGRSPNLSTFESVCSRVHTCRGALNPVPETVQWWFLCWRWNCETTTVTGSVQQSILALLKRNDKKRGAKVWKFYTIATPAGWSLEAENAVEVSWLFYEALYSRELKNQCDRSLEMISSDRSTRTCRPFRL